MSSNIRISAICVYCNSDFIAKTTITKCCSNHCAKRHYKIKKREEKLRQASIQDVVVASDSQNKEGELLARVNSREILSLREAAFFLGVSQLTIRRWLKAKKFVRLKSAGSTFLTKRA
jgi:ribosomal protein L35